MAGCCAPPRSVLLRTLKRMSSSHESRVILWDIGWRWLKGYNAPLMMVVFSCMAGTITLDTKSLSVGTLYIIHV